MHDRERGPAAAAGSTKHLEGAGRANERAAKRRVYERSKYKPCIRQHLLRLCCIGIKSCGERLAGGMHADTWTCGRHEVLEMDLKGARVRQAEMERRRERHISYVIRHTSHVTHHTSHITHHTSHITHHTSHITHHTSHIAHHTSHITHHTSHITHHLLPSLQADVDSAYLQTHERSRQSARARARRRTVSSSPPF